MLNGKVSVIFSFYNDAKYLNQSIDSILMQSYQDIELIMIDNGSTDNSLEIAQKYQKKDNRIKIIVSDRNYYGGGYNFRKLLKEATGKYIKVFCADDVMLSHCLKTQVDFLNKNQKYIACFSQMRAIDDNDNILKNSFLCESKNNRFEYLNHIFYNYNAFLFPTFIIRKEFLSEDMLDLRLLHFFDVKLWVETLKKGEVYVLDECLINYRVRSDGGNISDITKNQKKMRTYIFELHLFYEEYFKIDNFDLLQKIFKKEINLKNLNLDQSEDRDLIPLITAILLYNSEKFKPFYLCLHKNIALLKIFDLIKDEKLFNKMEARLGVDYKDMRSLSMSFFEGIKINSSWQNRRGTWGKIMRLFKRNKIKKIRNKYIKHKIKIG